jgi:hypothetical protein
MAQVQVSDTTMMSKRIKEGLTIITLKPIQLGELDTDYEKVS